MMNRRCFLCGAEGHYSADCSYEWWSKLSLPELSADTPDWVEDAVRILSLPGYRGDGLNRSDIGEVEGVYHTLTFPHDRVVYPHGTSLNGEALTEFSCRLGSVLVWFYVSYSDFVVVFCKTS